MFRHYYWLVLAEMSVNFTDRLCLTKEVIMLPCREKLRIRTFASSLISVDVEPLICLKESSTKMLFVHFLSVFRLLVSAVSLERQASLGLGFLQTLEIISILDGCRLNKHAAELHSLFLFHLPLAIRPLPPGLHVGDFVELVAGCQGSRPGVTARGHGQGRTRGVWAARLKIIKRAPAICGSLKNWLGLLFQISNQNKKRPFQKRKYYTVKINWHFVSLHPRKC